MTTPEPRTPIAGALGNAAQLTPELVAYYTSVGAVSVIDQCIFTNTSNVRARLMELHIVPALQSPSDATIIFTRQTIGPFATYTCTEAVGQVIPDGASVMASCGPEGVRIMRLSGRIGV